MKLHIKVFPESSDAYGILGNAYMAKSEDKLAIESFRKSLHLDPKNKNAKEKLKKLEKIR